MPILFHCQLQTPEEFANIRDDIERRINKVCSKQAFASYMALNEAVNNAFEHGKQDKKGFVKIRISILRGRTLLICVKDPGNGYTRAAAQEELSWDEGGRGLFLMEQMMDKVMYNRSRNQVLMMKRLEE